MNAPSDAALLIGLDSHGLAVARALASRGVPVYAIERDPRLPGVASRHLTGHFPVTDFSEEHLLPALRDTRAALKAHRHVVLFPMNDRQVGIVARHIGELSTLYRISWADAAATVLRLQRKDSLDDASRTQELQYPRSVVLERAEDLRAVTGFRLPVILKPVMPLSSFKTHVVHSLDEARAFVAGKLSDLPILCQEYIEGGDDALFFGELLLDHGRPLFGMTGRKLLSHPPGQGQATVAETHANAEVLRLTAQFFAGSDLSGPAALELKRDPQGGFWVIEPTIGRTEFLVELCIAAGFNQPWMEFELACARPVEPPERLTDRVWYDTEREPLAYLRLSRQHRSLAPRGKAPVFPYWGHGDLRPWLRAMGHAIRMRWFRLWGR